MVSFALLYLFALFTLSNCFVLLHGSPENVADYNLTLEDASYIPSHVEARTDLTPILNPYGFSNVCSLSECGDFHIVAYYRDAHNCDIIIRRLDYFNWTIDLSLFIQSLRLDEHGNSVQHAFTREVFNIGNSSSYMKSISVKTSTVLFPSLNIYQRQSIPKVIIQTFATRAVQSIYHWNAYKTFVELNPEYEFRMYTDKECRQFVKTYMSNRFLDAYDILISPTFKADLFRYAYLAVNGGCYFDHKMISRVPLRKVIRTNDTLLVCADAYARNGMPPYSLEDTERLYNAVICSKKGEDRIWLTIEKILQNIESRHSVGSDLSLTGPVAFYRAIRGNITEDNLRFKHGVRLKSIMHVRRKYEDFYVKERLTNQIMLTKFYKGYFADPRHRYGTLWKAHTIYFDKLMHFQHWKVFAYPGQKRCVRADFTKKGSLMLRLLTSNSFYEMPQPLPDENDDGIASPFICHHIKLLVLNDKTSEEHWVEIPSANIPSGSRYALELPLH
ncbi:hypothetical protein EON65_18430 [archaeon]|nr:MAG: hypothetical protein EON65_18430 [archaeon]